MMKTDETIPFGSLIEFIIVSIIITLLFLCIVLRYHDIDINNVKKHDILYYDLD
jgi:hypothetical protein